MISLHHKPIKRFSLLGTIRDDSSIERLRLEYRKLLEDSMRLSGYVPRIDIDEDFTIEYNNKQETFNFEISAYGVYVGKKKSEWILGVDGTRVVLTQKSKLKEYSLEQESRLREK